MDSKIKYYSFNVEQGGELDEGLTNDKPKADYHSSKLNSTVINIDQLLSFDDEYHNSIQELKNEYDEMMKATTTRIYTDDEANSEAQHIYTEMKENQGVYDDSSEDYDTNEKSVVLEYVNIGEYDKRIVNGFINKVNENSDGYLPEDFKLPNIE